MLSVWYTVKLDLSKRIPHLFSRISLNKGRHPKKEGIFWEFSPKGGGEGLLNSQNFLQIKQVIFGMPKSFLGATNVLQ